jgi:hypothetical protein
VPNEAVASHEHAEVLEDLSPSIAAGSTSNAHRFDDPPRSSAAPTLPRSVRWLAVADHGQEPIRAKATRALPRCPKSAARQIGLLRVVVGDVAGAGAGWRSRPAWGWSNPDHPGHALLPLLATLLSNGTIGDALVAELRGDGARSVGVLCDDRGGQADADHAINGRAKQRARPSIALTDSDCDAVIDAMRMAAEKRVEGFSASPGDGTTGTPRGSSRRASPVRPGAARPNSRWASDLRQQHWRSPRVQRGAGTSV